jgi:F-type H+-transporting ATPase subunit b
MLSLDGTFLVMFLSFIIFMVLMQKIYFAPLMAIKHEREGAIDTGRNAAEEAAQKTAQLNREYEQQLGEAKRKAQQIVSEKRESAKGKAAEQVAAARQKALEEIESRSRQLNEARENVYQSLLPEREALSQTIIEKVAQSQRSVEAATSTSGV